MSSLLDKTRNASGSDKVVKETVDIRPLDQIMKKFKPKGPLVLKIDSEGYELEVIKGAKKTLKKTALIIAEVSLAKRFEDSYKFSELIAELAKHGFELVDSLSHPKLPPKFMDLVFAKKPWPRLVSANPTLK